MPSSRVRPQIGWWFFWASLAFLLLATFTLYRVSLKFTQGNLVYPLDDAYMHLTMARNFAERGGFGFSPGHILFASSSPLYTLTLALIFKVAGVHAGISILLNLILGISVLVVSFLSFRSERVPPWLIGCSLGATIMLVPLPLAILSGMEHVMQILSVLLYLSCVGKFWRAGPMHTQAYLPIGLAAMVCTSTRYESVFLLAVSCALLSLRHRFAAILAIGTGGALGLLVPGLYSVWHGGHFLPVSVLLKRNVPESLSPSSLITFFHGAINTVSTQPYLVLLMVAVLAGCFYAQHAVGTFWNRHTATGVVWITACCLHILFARFGWVFRYEAYLIAGGLFLITESLAFFLNTRQPPLPGTVRQSFLFRAYPLAFAALFFLPFLTRAIDAWRIYGGATRNIYQQQVQMSRFIRAYYPQSRIALNDIGAVSFYTEARMFDIFGLATPQVADAKLAKQFDTARLGQLSRDAGSEIAIAYVHWLYELPDGLPRSWKPVATWTIPNNVVCGSDTVTFFAIDPSTGPQLKHNLAAFRSELPGDVKQKILD